MFTSTPSKLIVVTLPPAGFVAVLFVLGFGWTGFDWQYWTAFPIGVSWFFAGVIFQVWSGRWWEE